MSQLEYLTAFVAIVIGIAVTNLMTSLHRLIIARERVRWHVLPLAWSALLFFLIVSYWWGNYQRFQQHDLLFLFLFELLGPILLFLAAGAALPDDVPPRSTAPSGSEGPGQSARRPASENTNDDVNLRSYYMQQRRYFFGMIGLFLLHEDADILLHRAFEVGRPTGSDAAMLLSLAGAGLCGALAYSRNRVLHGIGTALAVGLAIGYAVLFEFQFGAS